MKRLQRVEHGLQTIRALANLRELLQEQFSKLRLQSQF